MILRSIHMKLVYNYERGQYYNSSRTESKYEQMQVSIMFTTGTEAMSEVSPEEKDDVINTKVWYRTQLYHNQCIAQTILTQQLCFVIAASFALSSSWY